MKLIILLNLLFSSSLLAEEGWNAAKARKAAVGSQAMQDYKKCTSQAKSAEAFRKCREEFMKNKDQMQKEIHEAATSED